MVNNFDQYPVLVAGLKCASTHFAALLSLAFPQKITGILKKITGFKKKLPD